MSKFLQGHVCAKIGSKNPSRQEQRADEKICSPGPTFRKFAKSDQDCDRATPSKPSRATRMLLARRLREIREEKGLSQSDVSRFVSLRKAYISRVEDAEHIPPLRILQRWARALEVPLYQFFYDGKTRPQQLHVSELQKAAEVATNGSHDRYLREIRRLLPRLSEPNRTLLLEMAQTIHRRGPRRPLLSPRQAISRAIAG
jgi:transcriptional regulator with XRE-family HTH domain